MTRLTVNKSFLTLQNLETLGKLHFQKIYGLGLQVGSFKKYLCKLVSLVDSLTLSEKALSREEIPSTGMW